MFLAAVALVVPDSKQWVHEHSFPCLAEAGGSIPALCETHQATGTVGWCGSCHLSRSRDGLPWPFCMSWHKGQVPSLIRAPVGQQAQTMGWQMSFQARQRRGPAAGCTAPASLSPVRGASSHLQHQPPSRRCWLTPCPRASCCFSPFS